MKRSAAILTAILTLALTLGMAPNHASAAGWPCLITGPGYSNCAGYVSFSSYYLSDPFRPFQGTPGTGLQPDITVTFSYPYAHAIRVWTNDPDYQGNQASAFLYGCCWLGITTITGDGTPGVFSVGGGGGIKGGPFTAVKLHSDANDYVNWRVEYQQVNDPTGQWCRITAQSYSCGGITATTSPYYAGSGFDPFQQSPGTGAQAPIDITFGLPLLTVGATAVDPDYGGTRMDAYAADGTFLGTTYFNGDNRPGWTNTDTQSFSDSRGISRIVLTTATNDYVAFQGLTGTPL
jgi:hypothetical protein